MSDEEKYYLCSGENCPLKNDCKRFRRDINKIKEYHFAWPPVVHGECGSFDQKNETDVLFDKIKSICGDKNKD